MPPKMPVFPGTWSAQLVRRSWWSRLLRFVELRPANLALSALDLRPTDPDLALAPFVSFLGGLPAAAELSELADEALPVRGL